MRPALLVGMMLSVCSLAGAPLWSADDLAKEVAKRDAEVAKAQQVYDAALAAANERALKVYVRIAQREVKAGNVAGAGAAWKEVLRLDRKQAEATAFFTSAGMLDDVLAELDAPEVDPLGNPVPGSASGGGKRAVLVIGAGGALIPSGVTTLTEAFTARTLELVVANVVGDGVLFEEGGAANGQALGVIADEVHYLVRAGGTAVSLKAPFERNAAWVQIAAQFNGGELRLWLNGKLVAKGTAGFATIPAHGGGGVGGGDGGNSAGWARNCQFLLASMRLTGSARYTDQAGPNGRMDSDKGTLLAITPEAIAAELPAPAPGARKSTMITLTKLDRTPPASVAWTVTGEVGAR